MGDRLTGNTIKGDGENKIVFFKGGGHNHDGTSSTLIDSSKYSVFDFNFSLTGTDPTRVRKQAKNKSQVENFILDTVNKASLKPESIRLQPYSVTSDLLSADFILVDQTISSNGYIANSNGWAIFANGYAEFANVLVRGNIQATTGSIGGWQITSNTIQSTDATVKFISDASTLDGNVLVFQDNASSPSNYITISRSSINVRGNGISTQYGTTIEPTSLTVTDSNDKTTVISGGNVSIENQLQVANLASGSNAYLYGNGVMQLSDGAILTLYPNAYINSNSELLLSATGDYTRIFGGSTLPASLTANTGILIVGSPTGAHVAFDANEIQAKANGTAGANLTLNKAGGDVELSNGVLTTVRAFNSIIVGAAITMSGAISGVASLTTNANTAPWVLQNSDGTDMMLISQNLGVYSQSLTGGRNMMVISNNLIGYNSASSIRFKEDISEYSFNTEGLLSIKPVRFKYKEGFSIYDGDERPWSYGFIAEDVESAGVTEILQYDSEGKPDYIAYDMLPVLHHQILRTFDEKIKSLENRLKALEEV
jgi:hypothetical protein